MLFRSTEESSSLEGAIAASPAAVQEAQQVVTENETPNQIEAQPEEITEKVDAPFHEHPRFKEIVEEKNWYRQQMERLMEQVQRPPQPEAPQVDPYAHMTAEEQAFYRNMDKRIEERAQAILQRSVTPQLNAGIEEIARLRVEQFRKDHPDVSANSSEEARISDKIRQGYLPEDAYRSVMWDTKIAGKQVLSQQAQKQKLVAKQKANLSSPISNSSQGVKGPKQSFEDDIRHQLNTEWNGEID